MAFRVSLKRLFFATVAFAISVRAFHASWFASIVVGIAVGMLALIVTRSDTWRIAIIIVSMLGGAGMAGTVILGHPHSYPDIPSFFQGAVAGGFCGWILIRFIEVAGRQSP